MLQPEVTNCRGLCCDVVVCFLVVMQEPRSVHWLREAAEAGFAMAQKNLAVVAGLERSLVFRRWSESLVGAGVW